LALASTWRILWNTMMHTPTHNGLPAGLVHNGFRAGGDATRADATRLRLDAPEWRTSSYGAIGDGRGTIGDGRGAIGDGRRKPQTLRKDAPEWGKPMLNVDAPAWTPPTETMEFGMQQEFTPQDDMDTQAYWGGFDGVEVYDEFAEACASAATGNGSFDASGAWIPPAGGAYYDDTGAWCPPPIETVETVQCGHDLDAALQERLSELGLAPGTVGGVAASRQNAELEKAAAEAAAFQERARAVMAKAKFAKAVQQVVPEKAKEDWVPNSMCWDLIKMGACSRGLACPWRHSAAETEVDAKSRRQSVLDLLDAGNVLDAIPDSSRVMAPQHRRAQQTAAEMSPAVPGYSGYGNKGRRGAQQPQSPTQTPVRDWSTKGGGFDQMFGTPPKSNPWVKKDFDMMFDTPPKAAFSPVIGSVFANDEPFSMTATFKLEDRHAQDDIIQPKREEAIFGCTVEQETPKTWQPPSWAAVVKTPPGFKTLRGT